MKLEYLARRGECVDRMSSLGHSYDTFEVILTHGGNVMNWKKGREKSKFEVSRDTQIRRDDLFTYNRTIVHVPTCSFKKCARRQLYIFNVAKYIKTNR